MIADPAAVPSWLEGSVSLSRRQSNPCHQIELSLAM
jgi:hypothetical protein